MNPFIYEKTKDGEIYSDVYSRLAKERIIFLAEEITQDSASMVISLMLLLDKDIKEDEDGNIAPIDFWISCEGGDTDGIFAIYDVMQYIKSPVRTLCVGNAYSGGAILLAAGTKGMRCSMPNARIMIHEVQVSGQMEGTGTQINVTAREIKSINADLRDILARHTGNNPKKIERDCRNDKYMKAEEALKYGLIDKIIKPRKEIPPLPKRSTKREKTE